MPLVTLSLSKGDVSVSGRPPRLPVSGDSRVLSWVGGTPVLTGVKSVIPSALIDFSSKFMQGGRANFTRFFLHSSDYA